MTLIDRQSPILPARPASVAQGAAHELRAATVQRWILGLLWSLKPPRLYGVPATLAMLAKHYAGLGLPPGALPDPDGLDLSRRARGICTDLSVPALVAAYAKGLFPFAHVGPRNGGRRVSAWSCSLNTSISRRPCAGCCASSSSR